MNRGDGKIFFRFFRPVKVPHRGFRQSTHLCMLSVFVLLQSERCPLSTALESQRPSRARIRPSAGESAPSAGESAPSAGESAPSNLPDYEPKVSTCQSRVSTRDASTTSTASTTLTALTFDSAWRARRRRRRGRGRAPR
eukprot:1121479-Prorocentrum_minimum.AAC.1